MDSTRSISGATSRRYRLMLVLFVTLPLYLWLNLLMTGTSNADSASPAEATAASGSDTRVASKANGGPGKKVAGPSAPAKGQISPAASSGSTALFMINGSGSGTANGDYTSDNAGMNTYYRYFIEVPPGQTRLTVDLFDADVGAGGSGEATAGRDRARGSFDTSATYTLIAPDGNTRTTQFTTGDTTQPAGAD